MVEGNGAPAGLRRVVFTDRDGTLNPDFEYLSEPARIDLLPGVTRGIRLLRAHGYAVVCVTNQSGIARGYYTDDIVHRIHGEIQRRLRAGGTELDGFYYCPHRPEDRCACRKPEVELFQRAYRDLGLEPQGGAVVGDRWLDVEAGRRLGFVTVFVPERGREDEARDELRARGLVPDIEADGFLGGVVRLLYGG